jgi:hypothetical protein
MSFEGVDFEEIGIKVKGTTCPADKDSSTWIQQFVTAENADLLAEYLSSHILHIEKCHISGAKAYLGIYREILSLHKPGSDINENFNFLKAFSLNVPMMWC